MLRWNSKTNVRLTVHENKTIFIKNDIVHCSRESHTINHGNFLILNFNHARTKCCYGLTMDLLDNIATELSFEFHLYVVRDQLFGSKQQRDIKDFLKASDSTTNTRTTRNTNNANSYSINDGSSNLSQQTIADHDMNDETIPKSKYEDIQYG